MCFFLYRQQRCFLEDTVEHFLQRFLYILLHVSERSEKGFITSTWQNSLPVYIFCYFGLAIAFLSYSIFTECTKVQHGKTLHKDEHIPLCGIFYFKYLWRTLLMILNKAFYHIIVVLNWVSQVSFGKSLLPGRNNNVIYQVKIFWQTYLSDLF